jgi:hypothetical protein
MPQQSLQSVRRLLWRVSALARKWLAALLLLSLPGALLICILHCSLPRHVHSHAGHGPALFTCSPVHGGAANQPVIEPGVVQTLIQGLTRAINLGLPGQMPLQPAVLTLAVLAARLADRPPVPPPRRPLAR